MSCHQSGILDAIPSVARFLTFNLSPEADPRAALMGLIPLVDGNSVVVGLGVSLAKSLHHDIDGLRLFPELAGQGVDVPSTPAALWCWLRGADSGELTLLARRLTRALSPAFELASSLDAFKYADGRDLTGYVDGTENPQGDDAVDAALVTEDVPGYVGSSYVAVQQWLHNFDRFEAMSEKAQDRMIGRRRSDNEELDDAPASAHVKRTAQESFEPEAFLLRRSMPWSNERGAGLMFVAFARSLDPFEAQLRRMMGEEDGIPDALFRFTKPVTGAYFWCPPMLDGLLDLSALGL